MKTSKKMRMKVTVIPTTPTLITIEFMELRMKITRPVMMLTERMKS